jgi:hypothetical protein
VTACRFIREGRSPEERLCLLLEGSGAPAALEEHLDRIDTTVIRSSVQPGYTAQEKQRFYEMLRQILGSIAVLSSPLSVQSLSGLLHITKHQANQTMESLHGILDIPKDLTYPLRLHYPSFRDFLLSKDRCGEFWVDEKQAHYTLATRCIQLMSQTLTKIFADCVLLIAKQVKLRAIVFKNASHLRFNTDASTGSSICNVVVLKLSTMKKSINFCRRISSTGLRRLAGWGRFQRVFKQYYP